MNISKDQFITFEQIRQSGETNMFDTTMIAYLSADYDTPLSVTEIREIRKNYSELKEKYRA